VLATSVSRTAYFRVLAKTVFFLAERGFLPTSVSRVPSFPEDPFHKQNKSGMGSQLIAS